MIAAVIATLMLIHPYVPAPPPGAEPPPIHTTCLWMGEWICPDGVTAPDWPRP